MAEGAEYERGWQDAITNLSPSGTVESADLTARVAGYHRTLTAILGRLVLDHERIDRALVTLQPALEQAQVERDWLLAEASDEVRARFFAVRRAEAASGGTPEPTDGGVA